MTIANLMSKNSLEQFSFYSYHDGFSLAMETDRKATMNSGITGKKSVVKALYEVVKF